ncbi:hypothetical protein DY000_02034244 [Brassica cretica]|uniref:Uncharacterized protein n=1 Tax=Brassica cretica TaxID=69181 RepID=A0ABQ7DFL3_BRACR|nr:hypothetical protein DY000_02034244 [Brassica cretica]
MERRDNPASNRLVQEVFSHPVSKWCPRRGRLEDMKQGGAFEYEIQDGGHELKEKEVGDDPDSQIQQKSWPVSQNAKGINLVPCCSQEVFLAHHLSKIRGRLDPLCGAMGRYLCVEAGLRSAGHEVVELLVQDTQEEDLIHCVEQWECSQEVFFAHHLSKTRGRLDPLCGAMGRYLCVEAGLRSAGHKVVELLVQDTQEKDLIHCVEQWESACV